MTGFFGVVAFASVLAAVSFFSVVFLVVFFGASVLFIASLGAVFLAMLLMSVLLTFDVTGNTYEENVVQYKFWYSFLFMLMAIALISSVVRYFNLVNNYGITPNIRGVMFPLVGLVLIILRTVFEGY